MTPRARLWAEWLRRVHAPGEVATRLVVAGELRRQRIALASELPRYLPQRDAQALRRDGIALHRDLLGSLLELLMGAARVAAGMREAMDPRVRATIERAVRASLSMLELPGEWSPARVDLATDEQLAELVTATDATTRARLRQIILDGLQRGDAIEDMQEAIISSTDFGPSRALAIARTETTRSASSGAVVGMREARDAGVDVGKEWLSARDSAVRPAHTALDGQVVDLDERFRVPYGVEFGGSSGAGPGQFSEAGMVVNCRCTVIPFVK